LHLAVESASIETRRLTIVSITNVAREAPELVGGIVSLALSSYLSKPNHPVRTEVAEEGAVKVVKKDARLCAFLLACGGMGAETEQTAREELLVDTFVLSHHPSLGKVCCHILSIRRLTIEVAAATGSRLPWIELCQAIGLDPHEVVGAHCDRFLNVALKATQVSLIREITRTSLIHA
jgi:hypothetical protein